MLLEQLRCGISSSRSVRASVYTEISVCEEDYYTGISKAKDQGDKEMAGSSLFSLLPRRDLVN